LYSGTPLKKDGTCGSGTSTSYASGNYINYLNTPSGTLVPKIQVAQSVVKNLISSTDNVKFGLMTYRQPSSGNVGGTLVSVTPSWSKVSGHSSGTAYTSYVQKMDTQFPSGYSVTNSACITSPCTNRDALISTLSGLNAQGGTPIGEVLVEAGRSFGGCDSSNSNCGLTAYQASVGLNSAGQSAGYYSTSTKSYPNIIDAPCQKNYIVIVTDGMSTVDNLDTTTNLTSLCGTSNASTSTGGNCAYDGCACCFGSGSCVYSGTTGGSCSSSNQCAAYNSVTPTSGGNSGLGIDNSATQVTKFLYNSQQIISTFAVGFNLQGSDTAAIGMLTTATDNNHGHGAFYSATTQTDLSKAFSQILAQIYQVNSSYVAPVVPSSPQNRTYSGNRVYMGFFEPQQNTTWFGNLKKYGIGTFLYNGNTFSNVITDATGNPATWVDLNNDNKDDIYGTTLSTLGVSNGSFKSTSRSFWTPLTVNDAGNVNAGGAGSVLEGLSSPITSRRTIYTETTSGGTLVPLISQSLATMAPLLYGSGSTDTTDAQSLINFIYGQDVLNESGNGTSANRPWMMGDVLHSQPLIINYASYTLCNPCLGDTCVCSNGANASCLSDGVTPSPSNCLSATLTANEKSCSVNKSFIYVGGNDGMLHAFKDCNGKEAWAFIPYEVLQNLQYDEAMVNNTATQPHTYFVDASPAKYIYNMLGDGNINTANGDKVILVFGTGRGTGNATAPTNGSYYALDVSGVGNSTPVAPTLLWSITQNTAGFSEMAESWSTPNIVTMMVNGAVKVVAVFGAGYDNPNEDGRYGATQYFQGNAGGSAASATGQGNNTSPVGTGTSPYSASPKGRGIYLVEVATLSSTGVPSFTNSGKLIWSYTYGSGSSPSCTTSTVTSSGYACTDPTMLYSIPSDITAWDANGDGYADTLYVGDTGGNIWQFYVGDPSNTSNWKGKKIFSANPGSGGSADTGRKIFYKPSAVRGVGYTMLFFGTGDREHPTNTAVIDRMYAVKDPTTVTYGSSAPSLPLTEKNLMNVTSDLLQSPTWTATQVNTYLNQLNGVTAITSDNDPYSAGNYAYGWYIQLNSSANSGEKVLAPPVVFNGDATFNTYTPIAASSSTNSCTANLGTATQYDLNYLTGEAIMDKNTANDTGLSGTTNVRALYNDYGTYNGNGGAGVLNASDRSQVIGSGIPSGSVIIVNPGGQTEALTGGGGSIITGARNPGGGILPLYWRQK